MLHNMKHSCIFQVSTYLDTSVPDDLGPHVLSLWDELNVCFSDLNTTLGNAMPEQVNAMKSSLLQSLLTMDKASDGRVGKAIL